MSDKTYNGWTNYETWRVNLEIFDGWDSDHLDSLTMGDDYYLAGQLKDYACELVEEGGANNLATSYALAFLDAVNWQEIALSLIANHIAANKENQ
jgi:hypothetical protein